jgi:hypothetical protein
MTTSDSSHPISIQMNGPNYSHWAFLMRNFLKGKGLWKYVTGEKTCPKKLECQKFAYFESKVEEWEMNNISDFHSEMSVLWDQLALMEPKWTVDAELYYQYKEETRLVQFLMALQDDFESIRSSILHRIPHPLLMRLYLSY